VEAALARQLVEHWERGWNGEDVPTIMAPFAPDVVFSSPFVGRLTGDPGKTTIDGRDALEAYVSGALQRTPGIRYTVDAVYFGTDTLVLTYTTRAPDGTVRTGADSMRVDGDGRIVDWRSHYAADSLHLRDKPSG
jgi:hypothetical protein